MVSFVVSLLLIFRLIYLIFFKYRKGILYPEYFILLPPFFLFVIPYYINGCRDLSNLTLFGLVIVFLVSFISSKNIYNSVKLKQKKILISKKFNLISILAYIYLFVLIITIYNLLKSSSLFEILISNRLENYFEESIDTGSVLGSFSIVLSFFYYIKISQLFIEKKYLLASVFIIVELIYLVLFAVTRLSIVFPVISIILFLLLIFKISFKKTIFFSISLLFFLMFYLSYSNKLRTGQDSSQKISLTETFTDISRELDYENFHNMAYNYVKMNDYEYGYGWFLGSVVNFIPRFLYPNKPVTSAANRFTEKITGSPPSMYNPVITFTLIGDGYLQLGYIGIIINILVFYFISSIIFWKLYFIPDNIGVYPAIRFSFMAFIYFRAEIPFVQYFVYLILLWFIYKFSYER